MRETDAKQLDIRIEKTSRAFEARLDGLPVKENEEERIERREIVLAAKALLWTRGRPT
jgi:hypothetical protein